MCVCECVSNQKLSLFFRTSFTESLNAATSDAHTFFIPRPPSMTTLSYPSGMGGSKKDLHTKVANRFFLTGAAGLLNSVPRF